MQPAYELSGRVEFLAVSCGRFFAMNDDDKPVVIPLCGASSAPAATTGVKY